MVCDLDRFEVHTNFTNTPATVHSFDLERLLAEPAEPLRLLRAVMEHPEELRPGKTRDELTAQAATEFASLAELLRARGHEAHEVAHFLDKLLFCIFAEDAGLLPRDLLKRLAAAGKDDPDVFTGGLRELFTKMADGGGLFGAERIEWFNGGLFDSAAVLALTREEITLVDRVSRLDWSQVEPAIFGTLFERGLDPAKRTQLGAHYTDRESIMRLIEPVLLTPLRRDFEATREQVEALLAEGKPVTARTQAGKNPVAVFNAFLERLWSVRVLDPACGSGNFLYLALLALKDLELEANVWASGKLGVPIQFPRVGPESVLGIELNPYAAELARVVIWIGEIQWMLSHGFAYARDPILKPLDTIEQRDALLDTGNPENPTEAQWPSATCIIGNPPFLGGKLIRSNLGDEYVDQLFSVYGGRVPREADFCLLLAREGRAPASRPGWCSASACWPRRAFAAAPTAASWSASSRAATSSSPGPTSLGCWTERRCTSRSWALTTAPSRSAGWTENAPPSINANLTTGLDLTTVQRLPENRGIAYMGDTKGGAFDISAEVAAQLLALPNPDGRSNADVVRPWVNGLDVTRRPRGMWIIDFGTDMLLEQAALYEGPFEYVREHVQPVRATNKRASYAERWWIHVEPRPEMRKALTGLTRFIGTPTVTKHRLFAWLPADTLPDHQIIVFARDDDYSFGVLHSRPHEVWARGLGTQLREVESGFRYTPTSTFETFPFPADPTEDAVAEVSEAARRLNEPPRGLAEPARAHAGRAGQTYADQPLQLAAHLACARPRAARPRRARRLRLAASVGRRRSTLAVA